MFCFFSTVIYSTYNFNGLGLAPTFAGQQLSSFLVYDGNTVGTPRFWPCMLFLFYNGRSQRIFGELREGDGGTDKGCVAFEMEEMLFVAIILSWLLAARALPFL